MKLSSYVILLLAAAISLQMFSVLVSKVTSEKSSELDSYVILFRKEMEKRGLQLDYSNIDITFRRYMVRPNIVGVSYTDGSTKYVDILKKYYQSSPTEIKEAVVFHELGHTFGLKHLDDYIFEFYMQRTCPVSVMHSSDDMRNCYFRNRDYYIDELANRIKHVDKEPIL